MVQYDRTKIKKLRTERKMGITMFAAALGTSPQLVRGWESGGGMPQVGSLVNMMNCFNLEPGYFFREVKR